MIVPVAPIEAVRLNDFSTASRYCGTEARPKSHTLLVAPSLTSFPLKSPMDPVTHTAGSGACDTRRRTCECAGTAARTSIDATASFFTTLSSLSCGSEEAPGNLSPVQLHRGAHA
jgi:hypothetical protein